MGRTRPDPDEERRSEPWLRVRGWPAVIFVCAAALLVVAVWAPTLGDAFFLYDDFALLGLCQHHVPSDLLRESMASMFRPAAFLSLWGESGCSAGIGRRATWSSRLFFI